MVMNDGFVKIFARSLYRSKPQALLTSALYCVPRGNVKLLALMSLVQLSSAHSILYTTLVAGTVSVETS